MPETGASGSVGAPLEESGALPGNGLLPALGAGPFHLFRLHLDLRCDVLKKVAVTFPSEKVFSQRRPFGSQTLVVAQCRGGNLPNRRQARQNKKRRPIPRVIGSVHCIPTGSIFVSVVERGCHFPNYLAYLAFVEGTLLSICTRFGVFCLNRIASESYRLHFASFSSFCCPRHSSGRFDVPQS